MNAALAAETHELAMTTTAGDQQVLRGDVGAEAEFGVGFSIKLAASPRGIFIVSYLINSVLHVD